MRTQSLRCSGAENTRSNGQSTRDHDRAQQQSWRSSLEAIAGDAPAPGFRQKPNKRPCAARTHVPGCNGQGTTYINLRFGRSGHPTGYLSAACACAALARHGEGA